MYLRRDTWSPQYQDMCSAADWSTCLKNKKNTDTSFSADINEARMSRSGEAAADYVPSDPVC